MSSAKRDVVFILLFFFCCFVVLTLTFLCCCCFFFSFGLKYVDTSYDGKSFAQKFITSSEDNQNEKFPRRESNPGRGGESAES